MIKVISPYFLSGLVLVVVKCFTKEMSTVKAFKFALRQESVKFENSQLISKQTVGRWHDSFSSMFYTLIEKAFSNNQCTLYLNFTITIL